MLHLKRGQGCWFFELKLDVENTGKSPAQSVYASAVILQRKQSAPVNVDELHRDLAENMKAESGDVIEAVAFPQYPMQLDCTATLPDDWLPEWECGDGFYRYPVVIIGCVRYRFPQGKSAHVTAFRYGIIGSGSVLELPTNVGFYKPGDPKGHSVVYRHNRGWFAD